MREEMFDDERGKAVNDASLLDKNLVWAGPGGRVRTYWVEGLWRCWPAAGELDERRVPVGG